MGYYTFHTLSILNADEGMEGQIIEEFREECEEAEYALEDDGSGTQSTKWYDSDRDVARFSRKYPELIFKLHGEGEENDDLWNRYFVDGQMQVCEAKITYDEFDPAKLKQVVGI